MSESVDVLVVMEEMAGKIRRLNDSDPILSLADEARSSVADLIAKAEDALDVLEYYAEKEAEYSQLREAIARVKGGVQ